MLIQLTHSCRDGMERHISSSRDIVFLCLFVLARKDGDDNYDDQDNDNNHYEDSELDVVPAYLVLGVPLRAVVGTEVKMHVTILICRAFNVYNDFARC